MSHRLNLCGFNEIVHIHQACWGRHCLGTLLASNVDEKHRTGIPFPSLRDAFVFAAPSRQRPPHLCAPRMIALDDQCCGCPSRLRCKLVEDLPQQPIRIIKRNPGYDHSRRGICCVRRSQKAGGCGAGRCR